jgi:hypothetical protein
MKKSIAACLLVGVLAACQEPTGFMQPTMSVTNNRIRVGETATLTVSYPSSVLAGGNPNFTYVASVYIYSSNSDSFGPYDPITTPEGGFTPESDPSFFPVDGAVEITAPVSPNNVPPRIPVIVENGLSKGIFVIKGKSVGSAKIRSGFVISTLESPNRFSLVPYGRSLDGRITIEVIP